MTSQERKLNSDALLVFQEQSPNAKLKQTPILAVKVEKSDQKESKRLQHLSVGFDRIEGRNPLLPDVLEPYANHSSGNLMSTYQAVFENAPTNPLFRARCSVDGKDVPAFKSPASS
jgi:hypothetical protein